MSDSRTARAASVAPLPIGTAAELLGDERLGRDGEGVEDEGEEQNRLDRDLVGGQRRLVDPGGDRRRPAEHGEHRADPQQQVAPGGQQRRHPRPIAAGGSTAGTR